MLHHIKVQIFLIQNFNLHLILTKFCDLNFLPIFWKRELHKNDKELRITSPAKQGYFDIYNKRKKKEKEERNDGDFSQLIYFFINIVIYVNILTALHIDKAYIHPKF